MFSIVRGSLYPIRCGDEVASDTGRGGGVNSYCTSVYAMMGYSMGTDHLVMLA